jgi:hypothetical protein
LINPKKNTEQVCIAVTSCTFFDRCPVKTSVEKRLKFEVFTAVTMKYVVFRDVAQDLHSPTSQKTTFFIETPVVWTETCLGLPQSL